MKSSIKENNMKVKNKIIYCNKFTQKGCKQNPINCPFISLVGYEKICNMKEKITLNLKVNKESK